MLNLSDVHLVGHAGKDAELRTAGETEIADFSLATNLRRYRRGGDYEESVEWHHVRAVGALADVARRLVVKGAALQAMGRLEYRELRGEERSGRVALVVLAGARGWLNRLDAPRADSGDRVEPEWMGAERRVLVRAHWRRVPGKGEGS